LFWSAGDGRGLLGGLPGPRRGCDSSRGSLVLCMERPRARFPQVLTAPTWMSSMRDSRFTGLLLLASPAIELGIEMNLSDGAMELLGEETPGEGLGERVTGVGRVLLGGLAYRRGLVA